MLPIKDSAGRGRVPNARFALELGGIHCGFVLKIESDRNLVDLFAGQGPSLGKKGPGAFLPTEVKLECGTDMSAIFFEWVRSAVSGDYVPKNGAVVAYDRGYKELQRLDFSDAVITRITFPACQRDLHLVASLSVDVAISGKRTNQTGKNLTSMGSRPMPNLLTHDNFSFSLLGIDCSKVLKVSSFVFRRHKAHHEPVPLLDYGSASDLVITIPEQHSRPFFDWHAQGPAAKKEATLAYLAPNSTTTLNMLNFRDVELGQIVLKSDLNSRCYDVRLHIEEVEFRSFH